MSVNNASGKLITNEAPLVIPPSLAARIGLVEATILQQIHYYVQKSNNIIDGFRWVYNTYQQWQEQFPFLSLRSIRRAITNLEDLKLIRSERMEAKNWYQRKWYTVCYETLEALISPKCPIWTNRSVQIGHFDSSKLDTSYTKTSTKDLLKTTDTVPILHPVQDEEKLGVNFDVLLQPIVTTKENKIPILEPQEDVKTQEEGKEEQEPIPHTPVKPIKLKQNPQHEAIQPQGAAISDDQQKLDPQLKTQIEAVIAPAPMNPQIKKAVLGASLDAVQDAITVVKQRKEVSRVKNPAGLFVKAVKEQWKPSMKDSFNSVAKPTDEFSRWFDKARAAGVVIATQIIDGKILVYDAQAKPVLYEQMALLHPFDLDNSPTKSVLDKPSVMPLIKPPQPFDFSEVLAIIDTQLFRLRWSAERVREFLGQTYGKYSRALLADDELLDLQARLQVL